MNVKLHEKETGVTDQLALTGIKVFDLSQGVSGPYSAMLMALHGADVVKVFPSTVLGPGYFKDILAPLPQLKLTPTGGVDLKNVADWIKAGAVFVGAGSSLVTKDAMGKGDWGSITANAKAFVDAIKTARGK